MRLLPAARVPICSFLKLHMATPQGLFCNRSDTSQPPNYMITDLNHVALPVVKHLLLHNLATFSKAIEVKNVCMAMELFEFASSRKKQNKTKTPGRWGNFLFSRQTTLIGPRCCLSLLSHVTFYHWTFVTTYRMHSHLYLALNARCFKDLGRIVWYSRIQLIESMLGK